MIKNIKIVQKKEGNSYYIRNFNYFNSTNELNENNRRIIELIKINNLKPKSILEIGCANGLNLNQYQKFLGTKINYGVDLSSKAIRDGRKKYKKIKLLKISSLEINKIKHKFDLIIAGFFLYLLDREEIFNQFNLIYKKLNLNGHLIIQDFDPLFKHTNYSMHDKRLKSFKQNYDHFLEESGLFKLLYKIKKNYHLKPVTYKKKFKSEDISIALFEKIDFIKSYPENV
jgi:cyclopropane fatty-acyl-phospholipid synthase-like methyltransferase